MWINPIFVCQALEGDGEGCDGGGSAKVDEECLEIKQSFGKFKKISASVMLAKKGSGFL